MNAARARKHWQWFKGLMLSPGIHPHSLRGANVGVFTAAGEVEYGQKSMTLCANISPGYTLMGNARCYYANRVSFYFDFKGGFLLYLFLFTFNV